MKTNSKKSSNSFKQNIQQGFTLSELVIAVAIAGVIGGIAIPNYVSQLKKSQQHSAKATISGIKTVISAFADETNNFPTSWDDLNEITAVMTANGLATGDLDKAITLPEGHYQVSISTPGNAQYTITGNRIDDNNDFDIKACINLGNGASAITQGNGNLSAKPPVCN